MDGIIEKPKRRWFIVETHLGSHKTLATSAGKAVSNIRYRLLGPVKNSITKYWTAKELV